MQYDVATKVLMDSAAEQMIEKFLGIRVAEFEYVEELPQESVSSKRSDYTLQVTDRDGHTYIIIWEFLSVWKQRAISNLLDYTVRPMLKFNLPVIPVVLLLKPASQAREIFEEQNIRFKFTLVALDAMPAAAFMQSSDLRLLPFVAVMEGAENVVFEAEKKIYESALAREEKANLLTALTIFAGLKNRALAQQLVERKVHTNLLLSR